MKELFFQLSCIQSLFKRKYILLVDNTFNDNAELVDNFSLFEWLQSKPEYKDISYYIINKKNVSYMQILAKYPNNIIAVEHGKLNWLLIKKLFKSRYWLDSFQVISAFDPKACIRKGKITTIYTQHGINYFKIGNLGNDYISPKFFNKIVFCNTYERDLFKKYYGYNDKNIILAGLSRQDLMLEKTEKSVLVYFTFRAYLQNVEVTNTAYYQNIYKLLSSEQLSDLLKKNNVKLYVAVHHVMARLCDFKLPNIEIVEDKQIGNIKQNASMLITDFSSMCFDFMYKDRPVVFFRVDKGDPNLKLDNESYSNDINVESKNEQLYNICYDVDSVVNKLKKYIENDFILEEEYKKKNSIFFTYRENIREHLIENILKSPENISNILPKSNNELSLMVKYYIFGIPILKIFKWFYYK